MKQILKDTVLLGAVLWLIGYIASLVLSFSPLHEVMGWILLIVFTPVTIIITYLWFRKRERLAVKYYGTVGVAWLLIAIVLDYLFIVLLFQATYYGADVFVYYAVTFLIPVGVGYGLNRGKGDAVKTVEPAG